MSDSNLVDAHGNKIEKVPGYVHNGAPYGYRMFNATHLDAKDPGSVIILELKEEILDRTNLLMLMINAIAKDLYSRFPEGSHEYLALIEKLKVGTLDIRHTYHELARELDALFSKPEAPVVQ